MRARDKVFDFVMLALGLTLLYLFWLRFPAMPTLGERQQTTYAMPDAVAHASSKWTHIKPNKALTPQQVVQIQLKALQQNDQSDSGVITVFNFSSPKNKLRIGPISHLRVLVRDPAYQSMLNFRKHKKGQLVITENTAYQLVVIEGRDGQEEVYMFILCKQRKGTYKDCWMTEGIARMDQEALLSLT